MSRPFPEALRVHSPAQPAIEPALAAALTHLTARPGKMFRARLVFETAAPLGWSQDRAEKLASALEYFHLASLTLDDLPCMDDALERRGQPCVHHRHGEATAILAALALINRAYRLIHEAFAALPEDVRVAAGNLVDQCLGTAGLVGGQALDLAFGGTGGTVRDIGRIAMAKTGALMGLALRLPALAVRLAPDETRALRALSIYWGLAFQITDDLHDVLSSSLSAGKTTGRDREKARPNLALALGVTAARARLARLEGLAERTLDHLARADRGRWAGLAMMQVEVFISLAAAANSTAA